jgi:hypothetical protein
MGAEQSILAAAAYLRSDNSFVTTKSDGSETLLRLLSPTKLKIYQKVISSLEIKRSIHPHGPGGRLRRAHSLDSTDDWGFFEDISSPKNRDKDEGEDYYEEEQPIQRALSLPPPATAAPMYILESTLATQQLWYSTAGNRYHHLFLLVVSAYCMFYRYIR